MNAQERKKVKKILGKKIRHFRKIQNISQAQLAFESGLSNEQISRLENGLKNVTLDTLLSISEVLEIKIQKLFEFDY